VAARRSAEDRSLIREIVARGYRGGIGMVRTFIAGLRPTATATRSGQAASPSPEQTVWLLHHVERCSVGRPHPIAEREARYVTQLTAGETPIAHAARLAADFRRMLETHDINALQPWHAATARSMCGHGSFELLRRRVLYAAAYSS
jgi:hypothetical protein